MGNIHHLSKIKLVTTQTTTTTTSTTATKSITSALLRISESSDISETSTKSSQSDDELNTDNIEGLQQEFQNTPQEIRDYEMILNYEYKSINPNICVKELLGVVPKNKSLFKNKYFLITCVAGLKPYLYSESDFCNIVQQKRNMEFSKIPFIKSTIEMQIKEGGGIIYNNFNDIPKSRYSKCVLISPRPCCTTKYIQCLAANIHAVSHEWIIDCCKQNQLIKKNTYHLPAGWSILLNKFIMWSKHKSNDSHRFSLQPFLNTYILIGSKHENFIKYWSNVCKLGGGIIRFIKQLNDITETTDGYMITDSDFPDNIKRKAEHYQIPIVSSVWVIQSLIMGKICLPQSHIKLSCIYSEDDEYMEK